MKWPITVICPRLPARNWRVSMPTIKELESRIDRANALLKKDLPPKDRLRVAGLRLIDQKRVAARKRHPELDRTDTLQ